MRMHGSALRCFRSDQLSLYAIMENSTPVNTKRLEILRIGPDYIITLRSQVVVQNLTEIGSPILGSDVVLGLGPWLSLRTNWQSLVLALALKVSSCMRPWSWCFY